MEQSGIVRLAVFPGAARLCYRVGPVDQAEMVAFPYVVNSSTSILDLCTTFIEDSDGKWWLQIDFNTSLFRVERIARMFEHYIELLRHLSSDVELRIDAIPLAGVSQPVLAEVRSSRRNSQSSPKHGGRTGLGARHAELLPGADAEQAQFFAW